MKHTLKALCALMMLVAVLLAGCSAQSNTIRQIEEQRKTLEKKYAEIVAEYDGGTVALMDVLPTFYSMYSYYYQMYSMFGMSMDDEMIAQLKNQALEYAVQSRLLAAEFDRRGLTLDKTEEELNAESDKTYNDQLDYCIQQIADGTDAEKKASAELILFSQGLTIENNRAQAILNAKVEKAVSAIEDEAAEPTEEEISAYYDEKVASDEATYTANPTGVESAKSNGQAVCWMPEGYRTVKHVLIIPEDDFLQKVKDARSTLSTAQNALSGYEDELKALTEPEATAEPTAEPEATAEAEATAEVTAEPTAEPRSAEEIQADIDAKRAELPELQKAVEEAETACLDSVRDKTASVYKELENGKDFDSVMADFGEDPGMQSEPNMTTGYYVRADSTIWDKNFTAGAMTLEKVGDYSAEPVISSSGVHIIYYASDVTPGAVPLAEVHDALKSEKQEELRTAHLSEELAKWVEAANPVYHADKWTFE
ncbi:MAG: peptidylprolyl isomerase [Candidatus Faecivicinus sp.]|nr:peptidylprolyl isomerase [Candidatus Faecivicinus sp.]